MNSDVYKWENLKIVRTFFFYPLSQKENKIFRQTQMVVFFGTRKSNWLSCTNHKMPLNFPFSSQREAWHWLSTQMVQKFSFVSVKAGASQGIPNGMVHPGGMCAMPDICIQVSTSNRPIRLTQCCTQFKPFGNETFCFRNFQYHF